MASETSSPPVQASCGSVQQSEAASGQSGGVSSPSALGTSSILGSNSPFISSSVLPSLFVSSSLVVAVIIPTNLTSNNLVELPGPLGEGVVGALFVPPNLSKQANTTLITTYIGVTGDSSNQRLVSAVLNITLLDSQGNAITQLDSPLTICLALFNTLDKAQRVCLSYNDENKDKWSCEDECLTTVASKGTNGSNGRAKSDHFLCGQTTHLTNFALLLTGNDRENPCQSGPSNTLSWISLGMVGGAVLLVIISAPIAELQFRRRKIQVDRQLAKACSKASMVT